MKISLDFLSDFVSLKEKDYEKIKEVITKSTAEIETMEAIGEHLNNVVVGKIIEVRPHPNADKLRLCTVDDGKSEVQVVCGGSNLEKGQKVALAKIGAVVKWHGSEVVKMKKAKIRGEESNGMICAAEEIGLEESYPKKDEKEIVDLSHIDPKTGTPLAKALGLSDVVIDVDNHAITNRADLFSHKGFAREFVANGLAEWGPVKKPFKIPESNQSIPVSIDIKDDDICPRYLSVYITGIQIHESPDWMKARLSACGVRPINNIVDITNYVMLELGMPTHAFDVDQVKGKKWTMRKSKKGEKLITLDETEHELPEGVTVIDDGTGLIDLCGIMGGLTSGIQDSTNKILLHSPVYHPASIRKARIELGHISDAAIIYEKGVDVELATEGLARCVELILQLCPKAEVASKIVDVRNSKKESRTINLRKSQIQRLSGIDIPAKISEKILKDLGFGVEKSSNGFKVEIPSWRIGDIHMEADLIEEIVRIYGYDNIPNITPVADIAPIPIPKKRELERTIKNELMALGFNEIYTFAFLGPELLKKCGLEANKHHIEIANPISSDISLMRQSLLPWTLEVIADNLRYKNEFRLFELSNTYLKEAGNVTEDSSLIIATVGEDFRTCQGAIEQLGFNLHPAKSGKPYQHPGRYGQLIVGGKNVGEIYEIHPIIKKNFGIKENVVIAEVKIADIHKMNLDRKQKFVELPKYPSIKLDVSIGIPAKELSSKYLESIKKTDQTLITNIDLIDEYEGEKIEQGKRALTYSITYQAPDRTLTEEEVQEIHKKVIKNLQNANAQIR